MIVSKSFVLVISVRHQGAGEVAGDVQKFMN